MVHFKAVVLRHRLHFLRPATKKNSFESNDCYGLALHIFMIICVKPQIALATSLIRSISQFLHLSFLSNLFLYCLLSLH